jgi:predicted Zn-dependent protease
VASALVGLGGLVVLFEAGEHGGDLVFQYAGGVGVRGGDSADVRRLLVAGLYNNAQLDRRAGRPDAAAERFEQLRLLMPEDTSVRMLYVESLVRDRKDPQRALAALDSIEVSASSERLYYQKVTLQAQALDLTGQRDSARALLFALKKEIPRRSSRIDAMLKRMQ